MIVRVVPPLKVVKVQVTAMEYDFWTMRESPFHQLSDFQCIFLFAFGEVKVTNHAHRTWLEGKPLVFYLY